MSITQSLLSQISNADDRRIIRAIEALRSGAMTVNIRYNGGVLTAEVTSTVIQGKRKPVTKTETYAVLIAPDHSECTCKDWIHRGTICKHILSTAMSAQEEQAEQQQAA